jgi:hypothetical protein
VRTGTRPLSLAGFSLDRFNTAQLSKAAVRRRSLAEYESIYRDAASADRIRQYGHEPAALSSGEPG